MNPYEILQVNSNSSFEDIERSYREMAKKYHPDLNPDDPNASEKFKQLQNAYDLLKKTKNNNFHKFRYKSSSSSNDFSFELNEFFSKSVFKGRSIQSKIEVSLAEVVTGCKKTVSIKKKKLCNNCDGGGFKDFINCEMCGGKGYSQISDAPFVINQGCSSCGSTGKININKCTSCSGKGYSSYYEHTINIDIPQGVEHRSQLVFPEMGEPSLKGGKNGDLIIIVFIKEDDLFKRDGINICLDIPVSYTQILLGCNIELPCVTGEKVVFKIPQYSNINKFKIKGKGIPGKGRIGDMIVNLRLDVPKNLNEEYKNCIDSLSFLEEKYISNVRKNWKEKINKKI